MFGRLYGWHCLKDSLWFQVGNRESSFQVSNGMNSYEKHMNSTITIHKIRDLVSQDDTDLIKINDGNDAALVSWEG